MKTVIQRAGLMSATALAALALAACGAAAATSTPTTAAVATSAPAAAPTAASATEPTASTANEPTAGTASEPTAGTASEPTAGTAAEPTTAASSAPTSAASEPTAASAPAATSTKLNLNEVTEDELMATIPGFGSRMVREFMEYRPYTSIQQFRQEIGKYVSADQVAEYEKYVYVPIDVNQADAATLQQIPGVDASTAEKLIAGRPYADTAAFVAKLAEVGAGIDAAQAQALLAAQ